MLEILIRTRGIRIVAGAHRTHHQAQSRCARIHMITFTFNACTHDIFPLILQWEGPLELLNLVKSQFDKRLVHETSEVVVYVVSGGGG